mgnify:CR=1 FL=1
MKQYLLIDIGGTFIKYSLADEQARKISGGKVPTPLTNMDDLLAVIEGFAAPLQGQFVGCAISMPGRIDTRNGIAHTGGMLSAFMWEQPFAAQVEARLGVPVTSPTMASVPQQRRAGPVRWPVWKWVLCWCWAPASAAASS